MEKRDVMDAHHIEEAGALALMNARHMTGTVQGPVALTRMSGGLRVALAAIGDSLPENPSMLVVEIHRALSAFEALWCDYEKAQRDADSAAICVVGELTSAWLMNRLVEHVRALECSIVDDEATTFAEIVACAMAATRWAARWCWLRYKQPSTRLWANAAYLYQVSECRRTQPQPQRVLRADALTSSENAKREFTWLLFAQWVSPISLPVGAQLLFEQLLSRSHARPAIAQMATSLEDAAFDAGSGRVLLKRQPPSDASIRYIGFGPLREEICQRATRLALADIDKAEPAQQLLRSVIGRRTRTLARLGGRFEMLRRVHVCIGYDVIAANLRMEDQRFVEGFVIDRSEQGCRIRFERVSADTHDLCIGTLLQIRNAFEGEVSLGIVRWLKRVEPVGWELGVSLMRGVVRARRMRKRRSVWPTRKLTEDVFLIDSEKQGSEAARLCVLPKKSAVPGVQLIGEDDRFRCSVMTCIESGVNFDIALVKIDAMQEPRLKLCSLSSQGDLL
jgi:hypothetical protein